MEVHLQHDRKRVSVSKCHNSENSKEGECLYISPDVKYINGEKRACFATFLFK